VVRPREAPGEDREKELEREQRRERREERKARRERREKRKGGGGGAGSGGDAQEGTSIPNGVSGERRQAEGSSRRRLGEVREKRKDAAASVPAVVEEADWIEARTDV
jgi:hypothetical protein